MILWWRFWADAAEVTLGVCGGVLPCDQPGELPAGDLRRGGSGAGVRGVPGGDLRAVRLAAPRVRDHAQPFSPGGGDAGTEPERGHEMAAGHVGEPVQPVPRVDWPAVPRPLQGAARGAGPCARPGGALYSPEPGPGARDTGGRVGAVSLEQPVVVAQERPARLA